jgi:ClpP class serine protease
MIAIASEHGSIEALEKVRGARAKNTERATVRSGVGIIPIRGPLFKHANLMTEHCGATSYETVMRDFHQMLASSDVRSIVFDIDSPGGEANGTSELSDAIFAARGQKPTAAYIGGTGASAAYWIASACDKVFAADSAIVGSIGVQLALRNEKNEGEIRFVSSQSPRKNRDPATEDGAKDIQTIIDGLAEVFIGKVARNRGVNRAAVLEKFGQGAVFVASDAQSRGLIDQLSTLESVISTLGEHQLASDQPITAEFIKESHPAVAEHFMQLGAELALAKVLADQKRSESIKAMAEGLVSSEFCQTLISSDMTAADAAMAIIQEAKKNPPKPKIPPKVAFESQLEGLDAPPKDQPSSASLAEQQDSILALAQKVDGLKIKGN